MSCKHWKFLGWMFFGLVAAESLYTGIKYDCWLGTVACLAGFIGGLVYGKFKRNHCKES